ncbi:hypothetical protein BDZ45DRAFT_358156 [Acephala macrosclerotiorum]|nr:hypothetical protein BDZ45DRAFT_358156 [Acephala macrosclerotiorum]
MAVSLLFLAAFVPGSMATMLYNGLQTSIFSSNLSTSCDAALNTSISCPEDIIQLVTYGIQAVGWNTTSMASMCTSDCTSSLAELATAVEEGCGNITMMIDTQAVTFSSWVDHIQYKFGLICLADANSGDFCLDVEKTWNITEMVLDNTATWPNNTYKCYFDAQADTWDYVQDGNGTCYSPFEFEWSNATDGGGLSQLAALDYYMERGDPIDDDNYGWPLPLEFDEYPLEIQCSSCFLQTFKYGLENKWGDIWDNITAQIWANVVSNCDLDSTITPANDFSNALEYGVDMPATPMPVSNCPQNITISNTTSLTCKEAAIQFQVPSAGLYNMNSNADMYCGGLTDMTLCVPLSCPIGVVNLGDNIAWNNNTENIANWIAGFSNFTQAQFYSWNPYIGLDHVTHGTVVCMGPPGGIYVPPSATVAVPSVYTTTATPADPTPSGTIPNCGLYYLVEVGDDCSLVCEKFGLTFSDFINLNPSIDSACSNLILGDDYCVVAVNGTVVSTVTSTRTPATTTTSTSGSKSATSTATSSYISAPSPTTSGTTPYCYEWYTVSANDSCWDIEQEFDITLDEFIALNTYVDSNCDGLWPDYSYCVDGVPLASTTTSSAAATTTTATAVTTPTPIQTGMASGCTVFYEAKTGDGCYDIATAYGITLDEFYAWNLALDDDCSALWPDYYYCVGM